MSTHTKTPLLATQWLSGIIFVLAVLMILLGGVVHNTGSSLACPDWPLCFGQVFPKMEGQVAIEHSHRLLGTLIGILCILLTVFSYKMRTQDSKPFKLSLALLFLVIFQGVLGGVTVLLKLSPIVSTAHLATSQIVIALILLINLYVHDKLKKISLRDVNPMLLSILLLTFIQMCWGAFIRHGGSAVACGLGTQSSILCLDGHTHTGVLWPSYIQAQVHMMHRFLGVATSLLLILGTLPLLRWSKAVARTDIKKMIILSHATITIQMLLGILTVATMINPVVVTLHLFGGMMLWLLVVGLCFLSPKNYNPSTHELRTA